MEMTNWYKQTKWLHGGVNYRCKSFVVKAQKYSKTYIKQKKFYSCLPIVFILGLLKPQTSNKNKRTADVAIAVCKLEKLFFSTA